MFLILLALGFNFGCSGPEYVGTCTYETVKFAWDYDFSKDKLMRVRQFRVHYGKNSGDYTGFVDTNSLGLSYKLNIDSFASDEGV